MNLEEELGAVLRQEAEMRTTPAPDIQAMVNGGENRLRRRNTMRIGLAAAAVLLAVGGIYGTAQLGDNGDPDTGVVDQPSPPAEATTPRSWPANDEAVAAGTYRTEVGLAEGGGTIEADFTIDGEDWEGSNYPVAYAGVFAGVGVYQPASVAGGCRMDAGYKDAATAPQQLVRQLIRMPRSEVVQQPTRTEAFGSSTVHLQLRINAWCGGDAADLVADAPAGDRGISHYDAIPQGDARMVVIDFWVVDVDGTTVVVDRFHRADAPARMVDQSTRAVESITFHIEE